MHYTGCNARRKKLSSHGQILTESCNKLRCHNRHLLDVFVLDFSSSKILPTCEIPSAFCISQYLPSVKSSKTSTWLRYLELAERIHLTFDHIAQITKSTHHNLPWRTTSRILPARRETPLILWNTAYSEQLSTWSYPEPDQSAARRSVCLEFVSCFVSSTTWSSP